MAICHVYNCASSSRSFPSLLLLQNALKHLSMHSEEECATFKKANSTSGSAKTHEVMLAVPTPEPAASFATHIQYLVYLG